MSIGQKRVVRHLSDVITNHLIALTTEVNELRREIRHDELDQIDRDTLMLYDNLFVMMDSVASSVQKIKDAKYIFEQDSSYGKVFFLDFTLGRLKNEI